MNVLTVVFTGLMVFDGIGQVHLVRADHHKIIVEADKEYPVEKTITFVGFNKGQVNGTAGFEVPSLRRLFTTKVKTGKISLDLARVMTLVLMGGTTGPYEAYARCDVKGHSALFWQGVQWRVSVPGGAEILIDKGMKTEARIPITDKMVVKISNNYVDPAPGGAVQSHVPMYEAALKQRGQVDYHAPSCDPVFPPVVDVKKNNPVTCPPVSLR